MHFLQSVLELKIFIVKTPEDFLCILLVYKSGFIPICYDKAVQDDNFQKLFSSDCITLYHFYIAKLCDYRKRLKTTYTKETVATDHRATQLDGLNMYSPEKNILAETVPAVPNLTGRMDPRMNTNI